MADTLRVNTDQLAALGTQVGQVRDRLAETGSELERHESSIGSPVVAGALRNFEDHWTRGRRELTKSADTLAQMLIDSANSYLDVDGQLFDGISVDSSTANATSPR